jgi:hypothetical protein
MARQKKPEFSDVLPPGAITKSESGYINSAFVTSGFNILLMQWPWLSGPIILLWDGHCCHFNNEEALSFVETNNVHLLCLPLLTTHFLQPQYRFFFKHFEVCIHSHFWYVDKISSRKGYNKTDSLKTLYRNMRKSSNCQQRSQWIQNMWYIAYEQTCYSGSRDGSVRGVP